MEGTFARLFAGRLSPLEVATHLARAMEDYLVLAPDGTPLPPTHYWVYLHPDDCGALAVEQPALEMELAHHLALSIYHDGAPTYHVPDSFVRKVMSEQPLIDSFLHVTGGDESGVIP